MSITLIITERFDPHVDHLEPEFRRRDLCFVRFHLEDFPQQSSATYRLEDDDPEFLEVRGRRIALSDVAAVWYRRTGHFDLPPAYSVADRRLARLECAAFIQGLWHRLRNARWVSPPAAIRGASDKFDQLRRAKQLGFHVPPTCFSNEPSDVRAFVAKHQHVVYKPHHSIIVPREDGTASVVYTTLLDTTSLAVLDEIKCAPGIFQRLVPKAYELRITVVGDSVFACRILSQERAETTIDWRAHNWEDAASFPPHEATAIPEELSRRCRELVHGYGLVFGAIDVVVTPAGEPMFLELNPNGQWVWLEQKTASRTRTTTATVTTAAIQSPMLTRWRGKEWSCRSTSWARSPRWRPRAQRAT